MYTYATNAMLDDLKQLWQECFMDEMEYIDFYFKHITKKEAVFENILVAVLKDEVVSMLTMIPSKVKIDGKEKNFFYIYAVATAIKHRKKGYAAGLLTYAYEIAQKSDANLMLVPATEALFGYYEKLGFATAFWMKKETIEIKGTNDFLSKSQKEIMNRQKCVSNFIKKEIDADTYAIMRKEVFCEENDVIWEKEQIHYACMENSFLCGKTYAITYQDVDYFLMGCPGEGVYYVREHNLPKEIAKDVFIGLAKESNCDKISIKSKVSNSKSKQDDYKDATAYGMVYPKEISIKNGYLGLALD